VIHRLTGGGYEQQVLIDTYGVISVSSLAAPAPAFSMQSAQSPQFSVMNSTGNSFSTSPDTFLVTAG
jgi:hypothetical protein